LSGRASRIVEKGDMTPDNFKGSIVEKMPPAGISAALRALWWAANDDWDKAHQIVMNEDSRDCAWVHAYLHRVEGDLDNAGYWYRRANRKAATHELAVEWNEIAVALLESDRR
jgi:hypothetical protein